MGYRLKDNEGFSHGIKRIVLEQIDESLAKLRPTTRNRDEAIHDARVGIKKVRAVLRLVRDSLDLKTYQKEDFLYRDVNRTLSKVRDSAAMLEVIDKLIEHFSAQLSKDAFAGIRVELEHAKANKVQNQKSAMTAAAKALRQARRKVKKWPVAGHTQSLDSGL